MKKKKQTETAKCMRIFRRTIGSAGSGIVFCAMCVHFDQSININFNNANLIKFHIHMNIAGLYREYSCNGLGILNQIL